MSLELFLDSVRSKATRKVYNNSLKYYGLDKLEITDPIKVQNEIIQFIIRLKKEGKSYPCIHNYISAVKSYYQINDVVLNTRKIGKFMPEHNKVKVDRAYTDREIAKMLEVADLRMRAVILILASSGIRIGAIPDLKLRNLEDNKLTVYENSREEYFTFITPECKRAIDSYLDMRSRYGDKLKSDEPLIREDFNIRKIMGKAKFLKRDAIIWQLVIISKKAGLYKTGVATAHGFRKFFTTQLINGRTNSEIREMLLGHKIGLASAYYRPTQQDIYAEYEKSLDLLTINSENRLRLKLTKEQDKSLSITREIERILKQKGVI